MCNHPCRSQRAIFQGGWPAQLLNPAISPSSAKGAFPRSGLFTRSLRSRCWMRGKAQPSMLPLGGVRRASSLRPRRARPACPLTNGDRPSCFPAPAGHSGLILPSGGVRAPILYSSGPDQAGRTHRRWVLLMGPWWHADLCVQTRRATANPTDRCLRRPSKPALSSVLFGISRSNFYSPSKVKVGLQEFSQDER